MYGRTALNISPLNFLLRFQSRGVDFAMDFAWEQMSKLVKLVAMDEHPSFKRQYVLFFS